MMNQMNAKPMTTAQIDDAIAEARRMRAEALRRVIVGLWSAGRRRVQGAAGGRKAATQG